MANLYENKLHVVMYELRIWRERQAINLFFLTSRNKLELKIFK